MRTPRFHALVETDEERRTVVHGARDSPRALSQHGGELAKVLRLLSERPHPGTVPPCPSRSRGLGTRSVVRNLTKGGEYGLAGTNGRASAAPENLACLIHDAVKVGPELDDGISWLRCERSKLAHVDRSASTTSASEADGAGAARAAWRSAPQNPHPASDHPRAEPAAASDLRPTVRALKVRTIQVWVFVGIPSCTDVVQPVSTAEKCGPETDSLARVRRLLQRLS